MRPKVGVQRECVMSRDELIERLLIERHNSGGWRTPPKHWNTQVDFRDDDITTAKRRRDLVEAWTSMDDESEEIA